MYWLSNTNAKEQHLCIGFAIPTLRRSNSRNAYKCRHKGQTTRTTRTTTTELHACTSVHKMRPAIMFRAEPPATIKKEEKQQNGPAGVGA